MFKKILCTIAACAVISSFSVINAQAIDSDYEVNDSTVIAYVVGIEPSNKAESIKVIVEGTANILNVNCASATNITVEGTTATLIMSDITGMDISDIAIEFEKSGDVSYTISLHYYYGGNIYDTVSFSEFVYQNDSNKTTTEMTTTAAETTIAEVITTRPKTTTIVESVTPTTTTKKKTTTTAQTTTPTTTTTKKTQKTTTTISR